MQENKYNEQQFFNSYKKMPRSQDGLSAAGEWYALKELLPDLTDKRVLDIGCGFGWHCKYAVTHGARSVVGLDISERMLRKAEELNADESIEYRQMSLEQIDSNLGAFDVALSSLVFHYTASFDVLCKHVYSMLPEYGSFVFSVEHPIFTAAEPQQWCRDEAGEIAHWPVDHYFDEGVRQMIFLEEPIQKYHRTLASYIQILLSSGFQIKEVMEPVPDPNILKQHPSYAVEGRRPMFLLIAAEK